MVGPNAGTLMTILPVTGISKVTDLPETRLVYKLINDPTQDAVIATFGTGSPCQDPKPIRKVGGFWIPFFLGPPAKTKKKKKSKPCHRAAKDLHATELVYRLSLLINWPLLQPQPYRPTTRTLQSAQAHDVVVAIGQTERPRSVRNMILACWRRAFDQIGRGAAGREAMQFLRKRLSCYSLPALE